jgi:F-type H+-transporting ATPase subunit epsilon
MNTFMLHILSQTKNYFEGQVSAVYIPAVKGTMGILPRHELMIGQLKKGKIKVVLASLAEEIIEIEGGFINVEKDKTSILVCE